MSVDARADSARDTIAATPRLPIAGLLALASAGFVTILTEALPAGLLPQMSRSLGVSEALVGQLVTLYAIGSLMAAIPLVALTRHWPRRRLLMLAVVGFTIANLITALSPFYGLTLVARCTAGISAGLLWALLASYASGMVPPSQQGRAIAVAMVGTPLALSLGIPLGTLLGHAIGWQWTFTLMSLLSLVVLVWARLALPALPGQPKGAPIALRAVLTLRGVRPVLSIMLLFVLAHNVLYTYIAPIASAAGAQGELERYLLIFGLASLLGIWLTGVFIDRWMRPLVLASIGLFLIAAGTMTLGAHSAIALFAAVAVWGLSFGGAATLFQTAVARHAGTVADIAQSMVVTGWNIAIATGGLIGGLLLQHGRATYLSGSVLPLLVIAYVMAWRSRAFSFG